MEQITQLTEIGKYGLLGVLLVVAIYAIVSLKRELATCWKERLEDWKSIGEIIQTHRQTIAELVATTEARTRVQETMVRTQELSTLQIQSMNGELAQLRSAATKGMEEVRDLRIALAQRQAS